VRGKGFSAAQGRRVSNRAIVDAGVGPLSSRDAAAFSQSSKGKYATASRKRTSAQPRLGFRTRPSQTQTFPSRWIWPLHSIRSGPC